MLILTFILTLGTILLVAGIICDIEGMGAIGFFIICLCGIIIFIHIQKDKVESPPVITAPSAVEKIINDSSTWKDN